VTLKGGFASNTYKLLKPFPAAAHAAKPAILAASWIFSYQNLLSLVKSSFARILCWVSGQAMDWLALATNCLPLFKNLSGKVSAAPATPSPAPLYREIQSEQNVWGGAKVLGRRVARVGLGRPL